MGWRERERECVCVSTECLIVVMAHTFFVPYYTLGPDNMLGTPPVVTLYTTASVGALRLLYYQEALRSEETINVQGPNDKPVFTSCCLSANCHAGARHADR